MKDKSVGGSLMGIVGGGGGVWGGRQLHRCYGLVLNYFLNIWSPGGSTGFGTGRNSEFGPSWKQVHHG